MSKAARGKTGTTPPPVLDDPVPVMLDYRGSRWTKRLVTNLSGVAFDGSHLWTVSDERRTLERLRPEAGGFVLEKQFDLDDLFEALPEGKEADLEAVDAHDDRVWVCGSHSRTRMDALKGGEPSPELRRRRSRRLLGSIKTTDPLSTGYALPYTDDGSLRSRLRSDPLLADYLDLPSKENGLDIEGLVVRDNRLLIGLRGPVIDGNAVVVELRLRKKDGAVADLPPVRHLLRLNGLGIRDLARDGKRVLVLAGPVMGVDGPFVIHGWEPVRKTGPQSAPALRSFPSASEHPEGACLLERDARKGLLVVYDSPDGTRISGPVYRADWFDMTGW